MTRPFREFYFVFCLSYFNENPFFFFSLRIIIFIYLISKKACRSCDPVMGQVRLVTEQTKSTLLFFRFCESSILSEQKFSSAFFVCNCTV